MEQSISRVWSDVLGVLSVGANDNFFDLGGHSLLMVEIHRRLCELIARDFSIIDMFQYPTISALARHLSQPAGDVAKNEEVARRARLQKEAFERQRRRMTDGRR